MKHKNVEDFGMTSEEYINIERLCEESKDKENKFRSLSYTYSIIFVCFFIIFIGIMDDNIFIMFLLPVAVIFLLINRESIMDNIYANNTKQYYGKFTPPKNYLEYLDYLYKYGTWENKEHERKKIEEEKQRRLEEKNRRAELRKNHDYWSSVDPYEFEREIALLFKKHGFNTKVTKGSGDGGIDIFLKKDGEKSIVQCKRYQSKVGPSTVRDLYGAMVGGGYNAGYVVCPSGFSKKAFEFSKRKKITLIGLSRIMEMVNNNSVSFLK